MRERKIVFKHSRALGDTLMMTAGVRDFKILFPHCTIGIQSNFPELWLNNPYIDHSLKMGQPDVEFYHVGYPTIQNSNDTFNHFIFAFLLDMICQADAFESLGMSVGEFCSSFSHGRAGDGEPKLHEPPDGVEPFLSYRAKFSKTSTQLFKKQPDVHLSEDEIKTNIIRDVYGFDKYWVIAPGGKSDCTCKIWDWRRFQKVINHFDGKLKFVTIGMSSHIVEPLEGIINLTDKLSIREIFPLVYNADGCVSGVSFLMHLAAGLPRKVSNDKGGFTFQNKPCVSIYGGREQTSFTAYEGHQLLHTSGMLLCCDRGGCWQSRVVPISKKEEGNVRLCHAPVTRNGRIIQSCMDLITADDVIRAISMYYEGNILLYSKKLAIKKSNPNQLKIDTLSKHWDKAVETLNGKEVNPFQNEINNETISPMAGKGSFIPDTVIKQKVNMKEINILASLSSQGGGEQSAIKIAELLQNDGWNVHLFPWGKVHDNYKDLVRTETTVNTMADRMIKGIPLLFYANDNVGDFCNPELTGKIVENSSNVIIGINYINDKLPRSTWLSRKLSAIIFQNEEKLNEFMKAAIGFEHTTLINLFGAIDLDKFLQIPTPRRKDDTLVVLKHCTPDYRKYVTTESAKSGEKIHVWQKNIVKEPDIVFYERLLKDTKNVRFEFMEAHPEIVNFFSGVDRMIFHKWDSMKVTDFLSRGHVYLYRTSNMWRDQYPRVVGEALSAGLPVLSEPRDGTFDRIIHGDTGFYCVDYDGFLYALKLLNRKEDYRFAVGDNAKRWAVNNLDPKKWVSIINSLCYNKGKV